MYCYKRGVFYYWSSFPSYKVKMASLLDVFLLLIFCFAQVSCVSACSSGVFYITSTNATENSDCPTETDCPCVTLDYFAQSLLPQLVNTDELSLFLLPGVHNLNVPMTFMLIQHVVISNVDTFSNLQEDQGMLTYIRLTSRNNISVTDVSRIEIKNIMLEGGRFTQSALVIQKHSYDRHSTTSWSILLNKVSVFGVSLLVQPLGGNVIADINMTSAIFEMSRIEVKNCMYVLDTSQQKYKSSDLHYSTVYVANSIFLTKARAVQNTIVIFSPDYYDSPKVLVHFDNVTFSESNVTDSYLTTSIRDCVGSVYHSDSPSDIYISSGSVDLTVTNSQFTSNFGTAIYGKNSHTKIINCTFSGYTQGALIFDNVYEDFSLIIDSTTVFNNSIRERNNEGAAGLLVSSSGTTELRNCFFHRNLDLNGNSQIIQLKEADQMKVHNSKFTENNGTVIHAKGTNLIFFGNVTFEGNSAYQGGALSLSSVLYVLINLAEHTKVTFNNNSARQFGGAIYIDFSTSLLLSENQPNTNLWCFYAHLNDASSFDNVTLSFTNNSAGKGGDHVYGNSVKNYCKIDSVKYIGEDVWRHIFTIQPNTTLSPVSSAYLRVCTCDPNGLPLCDEESGIFVTNHTVYPGEKFFIDAVTVGAEFGTTIGEVYAGLLPHSDSSFVGQLGNSAKEHFQSITNNSKCTPLTYSLHSQNSYEVIYLTVTERVLNYYGDVNAIRASIKKYKKTDVVPVSLLTTPVFINITIRLPCPKGFTLVGNPPFCDCYPQLSQKNISCKISNGVGYISRQKSEWIGVSEKGVFFSYQCKSNHCKRRTISVDIEDDPDVQCKCNHSGMLCGGCREGYSVAIGSSRCLYCPNNKNVALLLLFLLAGPLLYIFIAAFDITVTNGAINGLLFYGNVVWIYHNEIFPYDKILSNCSTPFFNALYIFKLFIAWLNLDFGIEMCFTKGLDAFWMSMLQYCFPIYIWIIAYLVILVYRHTDIYQRYPRIVSRVLGKPTNVLVTFIYLSYTKIIRKIQHSFGFATLISYPDKSVEIVWALDGNVKYLQGRHIFMFLLSLLALVASSIYTIYILYVGLKSSKLVALCKCKVHSENQEEEEEDEYRHRENDSDVNSSDERKWKASCKALFCQWKRNYCTMPLPLYDAHFAPLNSEHKYWFGVMLLVRIVLLILFVALETFAPKLNSFLLLVIVTLLLVYVACNNIYRERCIQTLETVSFGNLILVSGGIIYIHFVESQKWRSTIVSISVGAAIIQFFCILFYRLFSCFSKKKREVVHTDIPTDYTGVPSVNNNPGRRAVLQPAGRLVAASGWRETLIDDDTRNNAPAVFCNEDGYDQDPLLVHGANTKSNTFNCLACC